MELGSNMSNNSSKLTIGNSVSCVSCGEPCEGSSKNGFKEDKNTSKNFKEDSGSVTSENRSLTSGEDSGSVKSFNEPANVAFTHYQVDKSNELQQYLTKNWQEISEEYKKINGLVAYEPGEIKADIEAKINVLVQERENAELQGQPISPTNSISNSELESDPYPDKKAKVKKNNYFLIVNSGLAKYIVVTLLIFVLFFEIL